MGRYGAVIAHKYDVICLAQYWNGWVQGLVHTAGNSSNYIDLAEDESVVNTQFAYRKPRRVDGSDYFFLGGAVDGHSNDNIDATIQMLAECNLTPQFFWFPFAADVTHGAVPFSSSLNNVLTYYRATPSVQHGTKYCIMAEDLWAAYDGNALNVAGTWLNYPAHVARWVTFFQDANYLKIGGRPVMTLYRDYIAGQAWDAGRLATIDAACVAAGLGTPLYINCNMDVTFANSVGCYGVTSYSISGLTSDVTIGASGPYANVMTSDKKNWTPSGSNQQRVLPVTPGCDTRARGAAFSRDNATYSEIEQSIARSYATAMSNLQLCGDHVIATTVTEWDEIGAFYPSDQTVLKGPNVPSRGLILDAWLNVYKNTPPATWLDFYHLSWLHADLGALPAGWALVQSLTGAPTGGAAGADQYEEIQNSTTTNPRVLTVALKSNGFKVFGSKGLGLGVIRFVVNGGANNDVNLDDGLAIRRHQLLFDSGVITTQTGNVLSIARVSGLVGVDVATAARVR